MDAQLVRQLRDFFEIVEKSKVAGMAVENQKIINELAQIGLASLKTNLTDWESKGTKAESYHKHTHLAQRWGVPSRRISTACREGRVSNWKKDEGSRTYWIADSELDHLQAIVGGKKGKFDDG